MEESAKLRVLKSFLGNLAGLIVEVVGFVRCFSSFFSWLSAEGMIGRNPCAALSQIKYTKVVKKPYTAPEMERLKRACTTLRDLALIEFLYASGCRVSEVVRLNRNDINFQTQDAVVLGKRK